VLRADHPHHLNPLLFSTIFIDRALSSSELALEPIRADSVIFLESAEIILHIEFQTEPNQNIPFRMTDYRLRLYRKYPQRKFIKSSSIN